MIKSFICKHCGKSKPVNPCLKVEQQYCSDDECQKEGKRIRRRRRYAEEPAYREKCKEQQKSWRTKHHSDQYQREYREKHPEYVTRNLEKQKARNAKRATAIVSTIIKPSPVSLQIRDDRGHLLSMVRMELIVNSTSLSALSG